MLLCTCNFPFVIHSTVSILTILCFTGDVATAISLTPAIKFNGGGHLNHSIFWSNLSPSGGEPQGEKEANLTAFNIYISTVECVMTILIIMFSNHLEV